MSCDRGSSSAATYMVSVCDVSLPSRPDCLIWLSDSRPGSDSSDVIVCGTYVYNSSLFENPYFARTGSILVLRYSTEGVVFEHNTVLDNGVLSVSPVGYADSTGTDRGFLTALSSGSVAFNRLDKESGAKEVCRAFVGKEDRDQCDPNMMCLNVTGDEDGVWCTTSHGGVHFCVMREGAFQELVQFTKVHKFEAWGVARDPVDKAIGFSCDDEGLILAWDARSDTQVTSFPKVHSSGVCCLAWPSRSSAVLSAGGFDGNVSFWDPRKTDKPISLVNIGHPVWNIKWHQDSGTALVSAMGDGCLCYSLSSNYVGLTLLAHYERPRSLVYSSDWKYPAGSKDARDAVICTSSFYDSMLHLWKLSVH